MFIKICPYCKNKNLATTEICGSCNDFIGNIAPIEENEKNNNSKKYAICPTCNQKVYITDYKIPKICPICDQDEIRRISVLDILQEGIESLEKPIPIIENNNLKQYSFSLIHLPTGKIINIKNNYNIIGKTGTLETEFFNSFRYISGQHISIEINENKLFVKDLNSTNGTSINGKPAVPLKDYEITEESKLVLADEFFLVKKYDS